MTSERRNRHVLGGRAGLALEVRAREALDERQREVRLPLGALRDLDETARVG